MIYFLLVYSLFIFAFLAFNTYSILRIWQTRMEGDLIVRALRIYVIAIAAIIIVSVIFIALSSWGSTLPSFVVRGTNV